jgi:hypothetical protein
VQVKVPQQAATQRLPGPTLEQDVVCDETGKLSRTVRRTTAKSGKDFHQSGNTQGTSLLYRLSEVIAAVASGSTIYLVEGEEDVHALEFLGVVATTAPMGATSFTRVDATPLTGAHVIAVPDQDDAGKRWLGAVRAHLSGVVSLLDVRRPATGKDASDHVAAGHGLDELILDELMLDEPPDVLASLDIITASDVEPSRVVYLWDRRIPLGAMTLMPGEEGIGKTTVGIRLGADLTRGTLHGEYSGTPRDMLIVAAEDGLADVVVPRLKAAGADLDRVHIVKAKIAVDGSDREIIVPRDLEALGDAVRRWEIALVWIDSLVTTMPDEVKTIAYKDTSKVLRAIGHWAEIEQVAVVAPWHLNKKSGSNTAFRIMDSRAFRTAVRSMLLVVADPDAPADGPAQGIVALDKANAGSLAVPALRYRIRPAHYVIPEVDKDTGQVHNMPASCGVAEWIGEVEGDGLKLARACLAPQIEQTDEVGDWLRDFLNVSEIARTDVIAAAKVAGFGLSKVKRAANRLGVHSREESGQDHSSGYPFRSAHWSLSSEFTPCTTEPTELTGETSHGLTEPIDAGQAQWAQSVQSAMRKPTENQSGPTEDSPDYCAICEGPISTTRQWAGKAECVACEQTAS